MDYFLIDYENVHARGFDGFNLVNRGDTVIVFHSVNAGTLPFETIGKLIAQGVHVEVYDVSVGYPNAMDFQLSTYLGYLIHSRGLGNLCFDEFDELEDSFYIVSVDLGYVAVVDFWKKRGVNISQVKDLGKTKSRSKVVNSGALSPKPRTKPRKKSSNVGHLDTYGAILSITPLDKIPYGIVGATGANASFPSVDGLDSDVPLSDESFYADDDSPAITDSHRGECPMH